MILRLFLQINNINYQNVQIFIATISSEYIIIDIILSSARKVKHKIYSNVFWFWCVKMFKNNI